MIKQCLLPLIVLTIDFIIVNITMNMPFNLFKRMSSRHLFSNPHLTTCYGCTCTSSNYAPTNVFQSNNAINYM